MKSKVTAGNEHIVAIRNFARARALCTRASKLSKQRVSCNSQERCYEWEPWKVTFAVILFVEPLRLKT